MSRSKLAVVTAALMLCTALPAFAAKGGNGGGRGADPAAPASCTVSGNVVSATGLPAGQLINFMMTDASGTTGWVLGYTSDGTWSVTVPGTNGAATYQFVSSTSGPSGSKYTVFASC